MDTTCIQTAEKRQSYYIDPLGLSTQWAEWADPSLIQAFHLMAYYSNLIAYSQTHYAQK